jgi:hypothetical protein
MTTVGSTAGAVKNSRMCSKGWKQILKNLGILSQLTKKIFYKANKTAFFAK